MALQDEKLQGISAPQSLPGVCTNSLLLNEFLVPLQTALLWRYYDLKRLRDKKGIHECNMCCRNQCRLKLQDFCYAINFTIIFIDIVDCKLRCNFLAPTDNRCHNANIGITCEKYPDKQKKEPFSIAAQNKVGLRKMERFCV